MQAMQEVVDFMYAFPPGTPPADIVAQACEKWPSLTDDEIDAALSAVAEKFSLDAERHYREADQLRKARKLRQHANDQ